MSLRRSSHHFVCNEQLWSKKHYLVYTEITSSFVFFDISFVIQATESPHIDQAFTRDQNKIVFIYLYINHMQINPIIHNYHHYNAGLSLVEEQVQCSRKTSSTSSFLWAISQTHHSTNKPPQLLPVSPSADRTQPGSSRSS